MFNSEDDLEDTIAPRLDAADADTTLILSVEVSKASRIRNATSAASAWRLIYHIWNSCSTRTRTLASW